MVDVNMWKKLREMRVNAGKTVPEVSKYLQSVGMKYATQTIYGWENGHSQPTIDTFLEMCRFYGVTDIFSYFDDVPEVADIISLPEREIIKKYRLLDLFGKEAVDNVLDVESRRCATAQAKAIQKEQKQMEASEEIEPKIIYIFPGYSIPMSAGTGNPAGDEYPEQYQLVKEPPRGATFIAPVSGDSMEPTFHDGDKVFVRAQAEVGIGQIGVFWMDGQQWIKERGDGELISHNSEYDPRPIIDGAVCQGIVLGVCDESYFE